MFYTARRLISAFLRFLKILPKVSVFHLRRIPFKNFELVLENIEMVNMGIMGFIPGLLDNLHASRTDPSTTFVEI